MSESWFADLDLRHLPTCTIVWPPMVFTLCNFFMHSHNCKQGVNYLL